jgi:hypothetical protein
MQPQPSGPTPSKQPSPVVYPSAGTPPPPPGANHEPASAEPVHPKGTSGGKSPTKRRLLVIAGASLVFAAGLATYAFAYYLPNKPENVWKSALSNTGKGYDKLTEYTSSDELAKRYDKGGQMEGSYAVSSGEMTTDGSFDVASDGDNATFSADFGLGVSRVEVSGIAKKSATSEYPDMYVKVDGITGFGDLFGLPQLDNLNNKWISIDHTMLDMALPEDGKAPTITEKDMTEVVEVVGKVSDKYVFTTEPENAAFKMREYVGEEKQNGKTTMHYKISPNKSNFKRYLEELSKELDKTKLSEAVEDTYSKSLSELLSLEKADDNLSGSEAFDAWVNKDTKILHKLRFTDAKQPEKKYAELLFNYDGGSKMPFSFKVAGSEDGEDTMVELAMTMDTDKHTFTLGADLDTTADGQTTTMGLDATIKPSDNDVSVEVPADAISLAQAMQTLGFGDYLNTLESSLQQNLESL